jgi:hypothetical protein
MRTLTVFALLLGLFGCSTDPGSLAPDRATASIPAFEDLKLGEPIEQGGMVLIPVSSIAPEQDYTDYVTLAEAKKAGWIEIVEVPGEEQVDTLKVRYFGPRPMILFAGELLLGGKQDRVVAKDTVVKPDETVDVMVFCVEPGRWEGETMHFDAQVSQVPLEIKYKAVTGDQQEVWDEVGRYNEAVAADTGVDIAGTSLKGGYMATTNTKEFTESLEKALKELRSRKDVVGVVIVLDGKVSSFEYFQSPRLFEASAESVIRGALASALVGKGSSKAPPLTEIADFVSRCLKSASEVPAGDKAEMQPLRESSYGVAGGVTNSPSTAQSAGAVVHGSFYEKK